MARERCWEWTGYRRGGYGRAKVNGVVVTVHRAAYEALVGPVPPGLVLDHLCRNKACYNPAHLEPVTNTENLRRGNLPQLETMRGTSHDVTSCPAGHPYTKDNLASWAARRGWRQCLVCHALREKARRTALREKAKRAA